MSGTTEAFARVKIDALLKDAGWNLTDGSSVLFEHALPDGTQADYVLCDRRGRPMAALEAKRASTEPITAQDQGRHYAEQLGVPFVFLSDGEEVWFLDRETDAHARRIAGFYSQDDLQRRIAARQNRRDLSTVAIERKIVDRDYQVECIEALSAEVTRGRRKLLVEMATGTGKTRTAAAFIKRLFEAGIVTRVLFLVDRIALARQAEDAFQPRPTLDRNPDLNCSESLKVRGSRAGVAVRSSRAALTRFRWFAAPVGQAFQHLLTLYPFVHRVARSFPMSNRVVG